MKQSLIFIIIISLLVLTIQTIKPFAPPRKITYKAKCPWGRGLHKSGRCTKIIPMVCPPNTRTTTHGEKCLSGRGGDKFGRRTKIIPMVCLPNTRTKTYKAKCPCGRGLDKSGRCNLFKSFFMK